MFVMIAEKNIAVSLHHANVVEELHLERKELIKAKQEGICRERLSAPEHKWG